MLATAEAAEAGVAAAARALRLHACWETSPRPADGRLFVWGEDRSWAAGRAGFSAPEEVRSALGRLAGCEPALPAPARKRLLLPSRRSQPLPSAASDSGRRAPRAAFPVPGIALTPADCLALLPRFQRVAEAGAPVSGSLLMWSHAARLALELLARQRFVPAVWNADGDAAAVWRPVLTDARDAERAALLARAAPAVCFELAPGLAPAEAVEHFLAALVDAGVRLACEELAIDGGLDGDGLGGAWALSLLRSEGSLAVSAEAPALAKLARSLEDWGAALRPPAAFRTALRLEPPELGQEALAIPGPRARWQLTYHLQAADDPSLLVPAARVWREDAGAAEFASRRVERPQEMLLADLGRAAQLFGPVAASLQEPAPSGCALPTEEAARFFGEAPRLAEAGLTVLLPGVKPLEQALAARVRAKARKDSDAGPARFGLAAIVDFQVELALGGKPLTEQELDALAELKAPLVRVRGQWVAVRPGDLQAVRALWKRRESMTLLQALQMAAAGEVEGIPLEETEADGWLGALLHGGAATAEREPRPPAGLQATLRPYQLRGLAWLGSMRELHLGALLADDMGLGKTVQLIASLLAAKEAGTRQGPALVVCPASVVGNWRRELERFAPSLHVMTHHGPERPLDEDFARAAEGQDVVVTTYALLMRDHEELRGVEWDSVVLDEAQNIKNGASKQAQAARALQAGHRVALTGTPVENRLSELWSIFQFLNPGYLGSREEFRERLALPVERHGDKVAAERVRKLVQPFLLRRLKTDPNVIRDLPAKLEMKVLVNLTREQATLYEAIVRDSLRRIEESEGIKRRGIVLSTLTRLKQVCDHPTLFLADRSAVEGRSGKLARLEEMLEEALGEGDKALVFTQFREMGELMQPRLEERFGEVPFLHGGTPRTQRDAMVERFQSPGGPGVFLLSLKAGGLGLNLTAANRVFHFDRWWNPAVEDQATDRAFRIGQKRNVQVHKFVCTGTLEDKIDQMLEEKRGLAASIVGSGEAWITEMSTAQLRELLALRPEAVGGE